MVECKAGHPRPILTFTAPRKELTILHNNEFVKGDQVKVIDGQHRGQMGNVDLSITHMTKYGLYQKVWVKLGGRSDAYSPERLLRVNPDSTLRPSIKYPVSV